MNQQSHVLSQQSLRLPLLGLLRVLPHQLLHLGQRDEGEQLQELFDLGVWHAQENW